MKPSGGFGDYSPIETLDMTDPPPKESHDPIRASALDLCTKADALGIIPYRCFVMDLEQT